MEETTNSLALTFQSEEGDKATVTLYDQKEDLTAETVMDAMNDVVAMEVLMSADGHLMNAVYGAKTIKRIVTTLF